ncbi:MAG: hypothetical protein NTU59_02490 [Coprothermobacterota bacterium]|nr:hypothetical protein [Coprothermobacterota bacterium]
MVALLHTSPSAELGAVHTAAYRRAVSCYEIAYALPDRFTSLSSPERNARGKNQGERGDRQRRHPFVILGKASKGEVIADGTLEAGQAASIELVAAGGLRAFRLVAEAEGQEVTATASILCLWVN